MYVEVLNNNIIGTLRQFLELLYLLGTRMSEHEEGEGWGNSLTGLIQTELELLLPALAGSSNIYLDGKTKTVVCMRVVSASDGARVCPVSHRCWQMPIIPNTAWDTAKYASWRGTLYLKLFYLTVCHYPVKWHTDIDIVRVSLSKPVLTLLDEQVSSEWLVGCHAWPRHNVIQDTRLIWLYIHLIYALFRKLLT